MFDFETFINMAFFTNVIDLQAALSACLTVRDWEMLTEAVLIPEEWMVMAYARLTELTVQELEVSSNILLDVFFHSLFLNRQSCINQFLFSFTDSIRSHRRCFANIRGYS